MHWLNYHHLHYFWTVVREGGVSKASIALNLTQPTISKQIKILEDQLGEPLFDRNAGRMDLTEAGRLAFDYAEEIFSLGQEFVESMKGVGTQRPRKLRVGASDVLPKLVCHRILAPVLNEMSNTQLICEEDMTERLLAELSIQHLDLVLADAPIAGSVKVKAFNHFLGECGVHFFAAPQLAKRIRGMFPQCLDGVPFLAPAENTVLRRSLDRWFRSRDLFPRMVAEFHDSALLKVFGREGAGVFAGPTVIADEICREYGVKSIGSTRAVRESFYAITIERKVKHPAVVKITENARQNLFGSSRDDVRDSDQPGHKKPSPRRKSK
ncbi:MAG: transcriptional activator NhaR [Verrucomicrobiota bacterium]|jgi:LysR family transcriptional activator of nhaA